MIRFCIYFKGIVNIICSQIGCGLYRKREMKSNFTVFIRETRSKEIGRTAGRKGGKIKHSILDMFKLEISIVQPSGLIE